MCKNILLILLYNDEEINRLRLVLRDGYLGQPTFLCFQVKQVGHASHVDNPIETNQRSVGTSGYYGGVIIKDHISVH